MQRILAAVLLFAAAAPALAQSRQPFVFKDVEAKGLNEAELAAVRTWNLRAALNVAALQCQYSPYLHTVDRYNAMLKQHGKELNQVRIALDKAFARTAGAKQGPRELDRFNTRLYQAYASTDAIYGFCEAAAAAGREALLTPLGKLRATADAQTPLIRAAMTPKADVFATKLEYASFEPLTGVCMDRRGRQRSC